MNDLDDKTEVSKRTADMNERIKKLEEKGITLSHLRLWEQRGGHITDDIYLTAKGILGIYLNEYILEGR